MTKLVPQTLELLKETKVGVLLVDKPTGWTSHDVVGWVRKQVGVKRVGHAGTLDPLATGLLIVLVGREFTKLQDTFMKQDKVYEVTAKFGITTDTYDSQGNIVQSVDWDELKELTKNQVELAMKDFLGEIEQTVPIYSAVKISGQKLYNMARHGEVVDSLPSRKVKIFDFKLLDFRSSEQDKACEADFVVKVSSGTYIRSLIHDLGNKLKVGANVTVLRRLKIGEIDLTGSIVPVSKRLS
ncbi:tRNA pseudouridine(55) synthase TruB [Patescibacteria group bacterium]|nr:tRNA pseudouridine(55) synthase TruB [Patescibacteria group bacterium]